MGLFSHKPKEAPVEQEPMNSTEQETSVESKISQYSSSECRACSGGDGICAYHANQFRRMGQRWGALDRKR